MTDSASAIPQGPDISRSDTVPRGSDESTNPSAHSLSVWEAFSFRSVHTVLVVLLKGLGVAGLYRFARAFGTIEWLVNFRRRRRFADALERMLGSKPIGAERRRWTREHFIQTRCDKLFYLIFDSLPRERARSLFSIHDAALLHRAMAAGHGVYVAMSHHGSIHIGGLLMALSGYKVAGVRERHESGLRRYVQSLLDRKYPDFQRAKILYADAYPRDIFRCLKEGYLLASLMDVARKYSPNQKTETVFVLGEERQFLSGPLRIAIRCRVPTLQAFVVPGKNFQYRLEIVEELTSADPGADEEAVVAEAMRRYAANVERFVRAAPSLMSRI